MGDVAPGIARMGGLQRHERSPMRMGGNFAYRSVFEKGLGSEVLLEPEATAAEDGAAPLVGDGTVGGFAGAGGAEDFIEAPTRFMAARPLALIWRAWELGLIAVLVGVGNAVDEIEGQLCELGKRCSGQNF